MPLEICGTSGSSHRRLLSSETDLETELHCRGTPSIMPHDGPYPPAEASYHRLRRSGWSTREAGFTGSSG
jgi:hypothetical protein